MGVVNPGDVADCVPLEIICILGMELADVLCRADGCTDGVARVARQVENNQRDGKLILPYHKNRPV